MPLLLASPVIPAGGEISTQYSGDGADISPPLTWSGLPDGTKSPSLVIEDPGASCGVFRHRAVFDTPSGSRGLGTHYSIHRPATGCTSEQRFWQAELWRPLSAEGAWDSPSPLPVTCDQPDDSRSKPGCVRRGCAEDGRTLCYPAPNRSPRINVERR